MRRDEGFTLLELMVTITIIGVLIAITIPSLLAFRDKAGDNRIKADLTSTAKAGAGYNVVNGAYTADSGELGALIPEIQLGSAVDNAVRVRLADVVPGDSNQVLLYARSSSGRWIGIKLVAVGAGAGRYTCVVGSEAAMTFAGCSGVEW